MSKILAIYLDHVTCSPSSKQKASANFKDFMARTGAKTLAELTEEKLRAFHKETLQRFSPSTVKHYYGTIKTVINRAGLEKADLNQINHAKGMLTLLRNPENPDANNPHPISPDNFHKLLNAVEMTDVPLLWRAMLLMGLNAALYMEDLCSMRWDCIDLSAGTYLTHRKKRGHCIRAAVLWPETIAALKALPRRGQSPYVFTSNRGTRYNRCTKLNDYLDFRMKVGLPDVQWSHLRDGAYTAASTAPGLDEKFARLLAGHAGNGYSDKYVKTHPKCVEPACKAVYAAYFESRPKAEI